MSNLTPTSPPLFRPNRSPCLSRWRCAIQSRSIEELRAFDGSNPKKPLFPGRGRDGIASCRMRIENSLYKSSIYCSILTRSRTACKRGSVVTFASMIGRKTKKQEVVIPEPDYRIPVALLGIAGGFAYQDNLLPAATVGLLGLLLLFQTTRVRFVFDEEALEVRVGDELQEFGGNVFVGGKNRWRYSSFVNWELWWPNFPILVYFKETQTKPEGQVHFFPVIFNGKQLYDVMVERAGPSKTSSPK